MNIQLKFLFTAALLFFLAPGLWAQEIETREVVYKADGQSMVGYLAMPKGAAKGTPAVLVVHEWWGQTDYPRKRAEMLAKLGYIAMAVDMFGDRQITEHPKEAGAFAKAVFSSAKNVATRFDAAWAALVANSPAVREKVAAIGYCFGGSVVLEMARQGAPLVAVASFHGGLMTPSKAQKGKVPARIYVANGAADPMSKPEQIEELHQEFEAAEVDFRFESFEAAKHGFTNPQASVYAEKLNFPALGYNQEADQKSWAHLKGFLKESFK
ncbi:MAG: dienelactone hydrolase family protein [bacterium]|nr:dienelactone hydrolase family protein [bacterium]